MFRVRPHVEIRGLRRACEEIDQLFLLSAEELAAVAPSVSMWSTGQHALHILLVNGAVWQNVRRILSGETEPLSGGPSPIGRLMLLLRFIPRGRAKSPQAVVPPAEVRLDELRERLVKSRSELEEIGSRGEALRGCGGRVRHFVFGNLNALEWLRFARIHTRHHLKIVRDVRRRLKRGRLAALDSSAASR